MGSRAQKTLKQDCGSRDVVHNARQAGYKMSAAAPRLGFAAFWGFGSFRAVGFGVSG